MRPGIKTVQHLISDMLIVFAKKVRKMLSFVTISSMCFIPHSVNIRLLSVKALAEDAGELFLSCNFFPPFLPT